MRRPRGICVGAGGENQSGVAATSRLFAVGSLFYLFVLGHFHLRWGAQDEGVRRALPGDDDVRHAAWEATRAIAIGAPAAAVWPWLVQLGFGRGGFYSYDRLDNAGRPSARAIVPELQRLQVGDRIRLDESVEATVTVLEPGRALAFCARDICERGVRGELGMAFVVEETAPGCSRLLARVRLCTTRRALGAAYVRAFFEPVDFLIMRRQLLGIKQRAEHLAHSAEITRRREEATAA